MKCNACGTTFDDSVGDRTFCEFCGAKVTRDTFNLQPSPPSPPAKSSRSIHVINNLAETFKSIKPTPEPIPEKESEEKKGIKKKKKQEEHRKTVIASIDLDQLGPTPPPDKVDDCKTVIKAIADEVKQQVKMKKFIKDVFF